LVSWIAENQCGYEPFVDDVTGLIVRAEYNAQTTLPGVLAMVMACVKPIALHFVMYLSPVPTNVVKTTRIHSWWYKNIARIDPPQRTSDPPTTYISEMYFSHWEPPGVAKRMWSVNLDE